MPGSRPRRTAAAAVAALAVAAALAPVLGSASPAEAAGVPAPQGRTFYDLGAGYSPEQMNATGTVVGTYPDGANSGAGEGAFVWRDGTSTPLTKPHLDGYDAEVSGTHINAQGDVAATVSFLPTVSGTLKRMAVPYIWVDGAGGYGAPQAAGPIANYSDEDVVGFDDADELLIWVNEGSFTLADGNTARWGVRVTGPFGADPVDVTALDNSYAYTMAGQGRFIYHGVAAGFRTATVAAPTVSTATAFVPGTARSVSDNGWMVAYNSSTSAVRVAAPDGTMTALPTPPSVVGTGVVSGVDSSGDVVTPGGYLPAGGAAWQSLAALFPADTGLDPTSPFTVDAGVGDGGALFGTAPPPGGLLASSHGWVLSSHALPAPVVNSTADTGARDGGSAGCDTGATVQLNGATVAECTLRAAIQAENAGSVTQKTVTFASGFAGTTIVPTTPLPALTASGVTLDFSTAPAGFALTGSAAASPGLDVSGAGAVVKGVHTVNFPTGLLLEGAAGGTVVTGSTFEAHRADSVGVEVTSASDRIGGSTAVERDLFPGDFIGVFVHGAGATGTSITGSWFGLASDGRTADPNGAGIVVRDASGTTIGGATGLPGTGAGNVLVAGRTDGTAATDGAITIAGIARNVTGTTIAGSTIGLAADGATVATAQSRYGIEVTGTVSGTTIGGGAGSGNVIDADVNGEQPAEVVVNSTSISGTVVEGNTIGTDATGSRALAGFAAARGIVVDGATGSTIGVAGQGNTVLGVAAPIVLTTVSPTAQVFYPTTAAVPGTGATQTAASDTTISGNSINLLGTAFVPDTAAAFASTVGIAVNGSGDVVSHNVVAGTFTGISVAGAAGRESVSENVIGMTRDGLSALYDVIDILVGHSTGATVSHNSVLGRGTGVALVASPGASVSGNTIGVASSGNGALRPYAGALPDDWQQILPGTSHGVDVDDASSGAVITGNVVGGIDGPAVEIGSHSGAGDPAPVTGIVVSANRIGVGTDGSTPLGGTGPGILLTDATAPVIGANLMGTGGDTTVTPDGGNEIANNAGAAIQVTTAPGARLLSNLMTGNGSGISTSTVVGLTPPALTAQNTESVTGITAELPAGTAGMVQLFSTTTGCLALGGDSSAVQPTALLWSGWLEALPASDTEVVIDIPVLPVGTAVVSALTDPARGTSRFSACATVAAGSGGNSPGGGVDGGSGSGGTGGAASGSGSGTAVLSGSVVTARVIQGGSATVIGTGFLADEQVGAVLHSAAIELGTFAADADGTVTVTFTVPADLAPGLHHVVLTGLSSGRTISIPLTVAAHGSLATTGTTDPSGAIVIATLLVGLGLAARIGRRRRRVRPLP